MAHLIHQIQWGSFPDWLGAFGTVLALFALIREMRRRRVDDQQLANERRDAEAAQARLVFTTAPGGHPNQIRTTIRNASSGPVFDVAYELLRGDEANPRVVTANDPPTVELPDHSTAEVWLTFEATDTEPPIGPDEEFWQRITFTDVNGLRWRRVDSRQPERVT